MPAKKTNKEVKAPKGMRDILGDKYYGLQGFFEKAQEICEYYGLQPIETPTLEDEDVFLRGIGEGTDIVEKEIYALKTKGREHLVMRPETTAGIMRAYIEKGMYTQPQPVMFYTYGPVYRHDKPQRGRYRQFWQFGVEIMGSTRAISDVMAIHLAHLILKENGINDIKMRINSLGDTDSRNEYIKTLTAYYRKHVNKMGTTDRQRMKTAPLRILDSKDEAMKEINAEAPQSLSSLNTVSKKHFKEVLEHLGHLGIEYEIDHTLVRGLDYYSHTVFEFFTETEKDKDGEDLKPLALGGGGRYDYLSKLIGGKKDVPAVGFAFGVDRIIEASTKNIKPKVKKKPKVYFIQLGQEAKLKSLAIIEELRQAKIPVAHSLSKDSLSQQLGIAEKIKVSQVLIFGQKEALEGTVIVRDMKTRSQKNVKIEDLAEYIKKGK
jgi:histidyl-tRNA synthetase